jgi:hypothetical protein
MPEAPSHGTVEVPTPDGAPVLIKLGFRRTGPTAWLAFPLDGHPITLGQELVITIDCIPPGHSVELEVEARVGAAVPRWRVEA